MTFDENQEEYRVRKKGEPVMDPQRAPEVELPFPTTDARLWAAEFVRLHGGDEELMLGWFANAIEHGRGPDPAVPSTVDD